MYAPQYTVAPAARLPACAADRKSGPGMACGARATPRPVVAADMALSDYRSQLRGALTNYFAGEFDTAARIPGTPW